MAKRKKFILEDGCPSEGEKIPRKVQVEVFEHPSGALAIKPRGYGDYCSTRNYGIPIFLEVWEGRLQLVVCPDINVESPTLIDMEGAKEENRKGGENG